MDETQQAKLQQTRVIGDYFNGFEIGIGPGDIVMTLMKNNERRFVLNCSLTIAKTFGKSLVEAVEQLESYTGHPTLTIEELIDARKKAEAAHKEKAITEAP